MKTPSINQKCARSLSTLAAVIGVAIATLTTSSLFAASNLNVNVVNTPNVNIANTPIVTLSGTPSVSITGTPNVNVANTPIVQDRDNPARQPFETSVGVLIQDGDNIGSRDITTVPAGKVLVIEQASVDGRLTGQRLVSVLIQWQMDLNQGALHYLVPNAEGTDRFGRNVFIVSEHVRLYFAAGETVVCFAERDGTAGQVTVSFSLGGYFVDAQ